MENIVITGSNGIIGTVLTEGLKGEYDITPFDLPEKDVLSIDHLRSALSGKKAVIHLAWDMSETAHNREKSPLNIKMVKNVLETALETGVQRVVLASSVHADRLNKNSEATDLLIAGRDNPEPDPDVPYGYSKLEIEALGREFSQKGLEVVCIRFRGVRKEGGETTEEYKHIWLGNHDCVNLVRKVLQAKEIPGKFLIVHGVSNNPSRRKHDVSNPLGWIPVEDIDQPDQ